MSKTSQNGRLGVQLIGALSGVASQLNTMAATGSEAPLSWGEFGLRLVIGFFAGAALLCLLRHWLLGVARRRLSAAVFEGYARGDAWSYSVFLLSFAGAFGVKFNLWAMLLMWALFLGWQGWLLRRAHPPGRRAALLTGRPVLAGLFLVSGFAALIYQIAWQRMLFTIFGVNIESVTLIVAIFMFGLGVGAVFGGWFAQKFAGRLPQLFLVFEVLIGLFGVASIRLIESVGAATITSPILVVSLTVYALLCVPTFLMGATLPILVAYLNERVAHLGKSVSLLYAFNTAGSALACFLTVDLLFRWLGLSGTVYVAAACNLLVGLLVFLYCRALAAQGNDKKEVAA